MSISMYQAFIPPAQRALRNLSAILDKIAAHAEARKIDPAVFLSARLFPDMLPLTRQIQIASDTVKGGAARLAGQEPPKWEDTETTFAELQQRVGKTLDYLASFTPEQIDGSEDRDITLQMRSGDLHFKGQGYLLGFVMPNLYFHITTAYAIARSNGVELGKKDFLGRE
ncbi:DUF1993 domain-containing protein [Viridibacterium curvum]|uniref:DUF1993 family protein n=1 Tax=Viridibacterium curvum TaxID=1101404 RepID=A0ABP9QC12_9RHOO